MVFAVVTGLVILSAATISFANPLKFRIDASRSKFMVTAPRGGRAWFKGRTHYLAVRELSGEVAADPLDPASASLDMAVRSASIEETGADFTPQQKAIIKKELEDIVLETAKFPDITFRSSGIRAKPAGGGFDLTIAGTLTLHGVSRTIEIPAKVTFGSGQLRAAGEFSLDRKKFGVNATDAFHGFVRVQHKLKFSFDIVAVTV
jgi:polyisoprenoid-binding protein YceI